MFVWRNSSLPCRACTRIRVPKWDTSSLSGKAAHERFRLGSWDGAFVWEHFHPTYIDFSSNLAMRASPSAHMNRPRGGTGPNFGRGRAIEGSKTYPYLVPNFPKCIPDFIPIFQKYIPDFIPILWKCIPDPISITKIVKIDTVPYTKIVKIDTLPYTKIEKIDTLPDGTSPYPKYV